MRHATDLVTHLVAREFRLRYRKAVLGWLWAIGQPLARLVVLTFIFTQVIDLGIEDYSVFLFTGLIAWTWFAAGIRSVTTSVVDRRDLLFRPGVPRVTVPVISALTDGLDYLAALPVLALFLVMSNGIPGTAVLLPLIMAIQFLLILGIGLPLCAANVYFRDVALFVDVALVLGFYLTPVFYDPASIPATYRFLIELNPIAQLIDIYRSILVDARLPEVSAVASVAVVGVVLSAVGLSVYRAASPNFIDEL